MKFSTKFNALVLGLAVLVVGCKEDKNNDPAPAPANVEAAMPECLLLQDSTTNGWVNIYKYNAKGQVTHITRKRPGTYPYFETQEYDAAGKLLRNNFHLNDSVIYAYNQYQYNADGLISSSTYFRWEVNYGPLIEDRRQTFTYAANGLLASRNFFEAGETTNPNIKYEYTHRPDGVIEERSYTFIQVANKFRLKSILEHRYDNQLNPFAALSNAVDMPIFTHHNVTSVRTYDLNHTSYAENLVSYQYNAKGFPVTATFFDGPKQVHTYFTYSCR